MPISRRLRFLITLIAIVQVVVVKLCFVFASVAEQVIGAIKNEDYGAGSKRPPEFELAERMKVRGFCLPIYNLGRHGHSARSKLVGPLSYLS